MSNEAKYREALLQIKAVKDIGAHFRHPITGAWFNDAAAERDGMYKIAIEALGLPAGVHPEGRCHNEADVTL